jgi:hypothetical protein
MRFTFALVFALFVFLPTLAFAQVPDGKVVYKAAESVKALRKKIDKGIEGAVEDMSFITRPIARSRLKDSNKIFNTITFDVNGSSVGIKQGDRPMITMKDGKPTKWTRDDGETFTVTHTKGEHSITQTFKAEDGLKTLTYVFSKDLSKLSVSIELKSPKLGGPMKYTLQYARQ